MHAVVLAAGLGTRLRPLTERWAKPVLPLGGTPVLELVLEELAAAAVTDVTVVVGHLAEQVRRLCGDGSRRGMTIRYAEQDGSYGSAHALAAAAAEPPYLVLGADTAFTPGDVGSFARRYEASGAAGALAVRPREHGEPPRNGVRVRDGLVERLLDPAGTHTGVPLWAVGEPIAARAVALNGAQPHELAAAFQGAIDAGEPIVGLEVGPVRDLTTPDDLVLENFPYLRDL
jgi:NDP-sugar pyrophosphorylase family protein